MRIALLQMRSIVGQIEWNVHKIKDALKKAADSKVDLVVTPELAVIGYPCDDLLTFQFILEQEARALEELKAATLEYGVALLVGHTEKTESGWFYNSASLFEKAQLLGSIRKDRLPSYNVFSERRHFVSFHEDQGNLVFKGKKLGISICEDAWDSVDAYGSLYPRRYPTPGPALKDERAHCEIHINLSASPYEMGKASSREKSFQALSTSLGKAFLWVNRVGAQDEVIFDGHSAVYNPTRILLGKSFEEDFVIWDSASSNAACPQSMETWHELYEALCMGIRDFVRQSGAKGVLLGLSGGIDSACVATLAAKALGKENVLGISLPSKLTSDTSKRIAKELAAKLGIHFQENSIQTTVDDVSKNLAFSENSLPYENLQSRTRGLYLMGESNKSGKLLLACGNKSEFSTGYGTLYGDIAGALAPIGDLYKTEVYGLCHFINSHEQREIFSEELLTRAPTAELAPGQKDSDALPPYECLDAFLHETLDRQGTSFIDKDWNAFLKNTTAPQLLAKFRACEFKRFQAPPILKISNRSFGRSWVMPIAAKTPS